MGQETSTSQILIIDTDCMLADLLESHFQKKVGISCIDSFEELLRTDVSEYSLVILNPSIGSDAGRQIVDIMRGNFEHEIPILLISSPATRKEILDCLSAGANDFISRPFEVTNLVARISKYLGI